MQIALVIINFTLSAVFGLLALAQIMSTGFVDQDTTEEEIKANNKARKKIIAGLLIASVIFFVNGFFISKQ